MAFLALTVPYANRVMFCDEANTLYQYASDPIRALFSYATPNNHMLHSIQIGAITSLAGQSSPVVRFPALAAAAIALALAYRVAARLMPGPNRQRRRAGLAAAALLATAFGFADYAINARGYTFAIVLTLVLIDLLFAENPARFRRRTHRFSVMATAAALVLTLPTIVLASGPAWLWLLARARRDRRFLEPVAALAFGTLAGAVPYLPSLAAGLIGSHLGMFGEFDFGLMANGRLAMAFSTTSAPALGAAFALAVLAGAWASARTHPPAVLVAAVLVGTALLAAAGQFSLTGKVLFARNFLYLLAPLAVLGGIGAAWALRRATAPAAALALALSIGPFALLDGVYVEKAVITQIEAMLQPNDWLIAAPCLNAPVLHYFSQAGQTAVLTERPGVDRVLLITRAGTPASNLAPLGAERWAATCQPAGEPLWSEVTVYACPR